MAESMPDRPLFFIHVMKSAGTTVTGAFRSALSASAIYPNPDDDGDLFEAMVSIQALTALTPDRTDRTRFYAGHFPFAATQMLGVDPWTLTVLREPVARVVSHLRQIQRSQGGFRRFAKTLHGIDHPTFDQIYADPYLHERFLSNHQCRVFGITTADEPRNYVAPIDVDEDRLSIAKAQLGQVDLIGLTEEFDGFRHEVERRFGIALDDGPPRNTSPERGEQASEELLARIEADNPLDLALYAHARRLVAERRSPAA